MSWLCAECNTSPSGVCAAKLNATATPINPTGNDSFRNPCDKTFPISRAGNAPASLGGGWILISQERLPTPLQCMRLLLAGLLSIMAADQCGRAAACFALVAMRVATPLDVVTPIP